MKQARSLGIASPDGQEIYELYVAVQSKPSVLARIATILGEKNVDILAGNMQCSDDKRTGYDVFYLEMAGATVTPERAHALLQGLVPPDLILPLHIGMWEHGHTTCRPHPRCAQCAIYEFCVYADKTAPAPRVEDAIAMTSKGL